MDLSALIKLSDLFGRVIHYALLCEQEKHVPHMERAMTHLHDRKEDLCMDIAPCFNYIIKKPNKTNKPNNIFSVSHAY